MDNKKGRLIIWINLLWVMFSVLSVTIVHAQSAGQLIRKGNEDYNQQKYTDAEAQYKKALLKKGMPANTTSTGLFNLGNSMYSQKRYDDAYQQYAYSAKTSADKLSKSDANYNMGNTQMEKKDWSKSIDAYKNALRINPNDAEARYNLAYAQEMLKKNGGGKNNNKDNKNQQNKNQQNKDQQDKNKQDKDQQNKDKQNKDKQNQDQPDKDQQDQDHPQPQPSKLTKDQAQQLLNSLAQEEKKLQDKADKDKKGTPVSVDKDW